MMFQTILFLGLYDSGECGIFAFLVNLEDTCRLRIYCDFGNYDGGSDNEDNREIKIIQNLKWC